MRSDAIVIVDVGFQDPTTFGDRLPRGTGLTFVQIGKLMRAYPRGRASDIR